MSKLDWTKSIPAIIFTLTITISFNSWSEVYQWKDKEGQIHFGDRPPNQEQATNISSQVNQVNISTDLSSPEMILWHEQLKEADQTRKYENRKKQRQEKPSKSQICSDAKSLLEILRGRVMFVDEQGKDMKISELARKERVISLNNAIRKHCS